MSEQSLSVGVLDRLGPDCASSWSVLHKLIPVPKLGGQLQVDSRGYRLYYEHLSVRRRLEDAHWFAAKILQPDESKRKGRDAVRNLEAFVLFGRSALECAAVFANDFCSLGLDEKEVKFASVGRKPPVGREYLSSLAETWRATSDSDWLAHLHDFRIDAFHHRWTKTTVVLPFGGQAYYAIYGVPEELGGDAVDGECRFEEYVVAVFVRIRAFCEKLDSTLIGLLQAGSVSLS